jgi:hypothetical protein
MIWVQSMSTFDSLNDVKIFLMNDLWVFTVFIKDTKCNGMCLRNEVNVCMSIKAK